MNNCINSPNKKGDNMSTQIKISVRSLVEFVLKSGSIDSTFKGTSLLLEGTKAHQKVQKKQGDNYTKEVHLKTAIEYKDFSFHIEGRCDGLIKEEKGITIDEIKSTKTDLELIDEEYNPVHWAQAKVYAYIYGMQNDLNNINVQLTYYNIDTEETKIFKKQFQTNDLEEFLYDILDRYIEFAILMTTLTNKRNETIKKLDFPFESYRKGQRKLAVVVYKAIINEKRLFVKAPTGIGKTISTIFPAVKALGENKIEKIFYLTAKTITRTVAEETFDTLIKKGLNIRVVTITAKEKICFKEETSCNKDYCQYAYGYYDRVNEAIFDILKNEIKLDRGTIEKYAKKYTVCPFEFSLDLSLLVDCIICDYNYVFDPRVSLKRFSDEDKGNYGVLIDEAHNLVDRARDMFSATLNKSKFLEVRRLFKDRNKDIYKDLGKLNSYMLKIKKECNEEKYLVKKEEPKEIYGLIEKFLTKAEKWLVSNNGNEGYKELLDLYFECNSFSKISNLYDDRYITYIETYKSEVALKLFCIDPSYLLHEITKANKATIYFSATLIPLDYYREVLGGDDEDFTISLKSPFNRENLKIFISNLSTRYRDRENTYGDIADKIYNMIKSNIGNYMVFFPSYKYMNDVYNEFINRYENTNTIVQAFSMAEKEREEFLESFKKDRDETLVGFAVLGGIFSEGIDLKGDRLNGVVVVSVGLPQLCTERDIIKDYYDNAGKSGYDYSYVYPGINKVFQAGGRLIRTENDKGVLILIDDRFLKNKYQAIFPYEWKKFKVLRNKIMNLEL